MQKYLIKRAATVLAASAFMPFSHLRPHSPSNMATSGLQTRRAPKASGASISSISRKHQWPSEQAIRPSVAGSSGRQIRSIE